MRGLLTVSLIVLRESLRNRIFAGLLLFLGLYLIAAVYISTLSLGLRARYLASTGMLGLTVICLAVTILFGLFSLYQEKERSEHYVLLSRITRPAYLGGRFAGTSYIIALFAVGSGLGIFLLIRFFAGVWAPQFFWAVYFAILEFTLLTGIGLLFYSLGVGFALNALLLLAIYVIGNSINEALSSFLDPTHPGGRAHLLLIKIISRTLPNFDLFNHRWAILYNEPIPPLKVILSTGYWLFYVAAVLTLSAFFLKKRDV